MKFVQQKAVDFTKVYLQTIQFNLQMTFTVFKQENHTKVSGDSWGGGNQGMSGRLKKRKSLSFLQFTDTNPIISACPMNIFHGCEQVFPSPIVGLLGLKKGLKLIFGPSHYFMDRFQQTNDFRGPLTKGKKKKVEENCDIYSAETFNCLVALILMERGHVTYPF